MRRETKTKRQKVFAARLLSCSWVSWSLSLVPRLLSLGGFSLVSWPVLCCLVYGSLLLVSLSLIFCLSSLRQETKRREARDLFYAMCFWLLVCHLFRLSVLVACLSYLVSWSVPLVFIYLCICIYVSILLWLVACLSYLISGSVSLVSICLSIYLSLCLSLVVLANTYCPHLFLQSRSLYGFITLLR